MAWVAGKGSAYNFRSRIHVYLLIKRSLTAMYIVTSKSHYLDIYPQPDFIGTADVRLSVRQSVRLCVYPSLSRQISLTT